MPFPGRGITMNRRSRKSRSGDTPRFRCRRTFPGLEKGSPENRRERQTLSLCQVPQTKSETHKDSRPLVLPELPQRERRLGPRNPIRPGAERRGTTMIRLTLLLLAVPTLALADDHLPTPDYHRQPGDPEWLAQVVQFHGHLGPSVVAGARMGMIGLRAVEAKGFFDVGVTCEGPFAKPPNPASWTASRWRPGPRWANGRLLWCRPSRS